MLLAIDAGNTNIVFAIWKDDRVVAQFRASTKDARTADEYFVWLKQLMEVRAWRPRRSKARSSRPWCRRPCSTCAG